jgi:hypothetical protein
MHGIELKSGHNDCWWNVRGTCTHRSTQRDLNKIQPEWHRNWDSKQICTLTQLGIQLCSNYKREPL